MDNTHILYVEDDIESSEIMRLLIEDIMQLQPLKIFNDSYDFLERVNHLDIEPDIFLLDIHVPPHSGFEMLTILRQDQRYKHKPIVALTASVMNEEIDQLMKAGFDGIIAKPVDIDTFPHTLKRIAGGESVWTDTV